MSPGAGRGRGAVRTVRTEVARGPRVTAERIVARAVSRLGIVEPDIDDDDEAEIGDDGPTDDELPELGLEDDLGADEAESAPPEPAEASAPLRPELTILPVRGGYAWMTAPVEEQDPLVLQASLEHADRLGLLAEVLIGRHSEALAETSRGAALLHLTRVSGRDLEAELGVPRSAASRFRDAVVRLPCGLVTGGFLSWLGPSGPAFVDPWTVIDYAMAAAERIAAGKEVDWPDLEEAVAKTSGIGKRTVFNWRGPIAAALARPELVWSAQARYPRRPRGVIDALVVDGQRLNERIHRMLIAGCLDDALRVADNAGPLTAGASIGGASW